MRGLYQISNTVTGDFYIGSGRDLACRKSHHWWALRKGRHGNPRLQRAWEKYGADAFTFRVLALLEIEELYPSEERLLARVVGLPGCYNIKKDARGGRLGVPHSPATRAKIAEANRNRIMTEQERQRLAAGLFSGHRHTPEARAKMGEPGRRRRGEQRSPEIREKIRRTLTGRKLTPEHIAKVVVSLRGRVQSPATRAKRAAANTGKTHTPETKAQMRALKLGKPLSAAHREKIIAAIRGRHHSDEAKAKMSLAARKRARTPNGTFGTAHGN